MTLSRVEGQVVQKTDNAQRREKVEKRGRGEMAIIGISKISVPGSSPGVPAKLKLMKLKCLKRKKQS